MTTIMEALSNFAEWNELRGSEGVGPLKLTCELEPGASVDEIENSWASAHLPLELLDLWRSTRRARLFEDVEYGQWGLHLMSPAESAERTRDERNERPTEFVVGDVVIGEFLGDQDLLVLAPSESSPRRILVALPMDGRDDWHPAAASIAEFLQSYYAHGGDKYWES